MHYISFSSKYDEWINIHSDRISVHRPCGNRLQIGDNVSLYSYKYRAWLEADVTAVDEERRNVELTLVESPISHNSFDGEWYDMDSEHFSIKHKRCNDPAPYQTLNNFVFVE